MATICIKYNANSQVKDFIKSIRDNARKVPTVEVKVIIEDEIAFINIRPLIFPFWILGPLIWLAGLILQGEFSSSFMYAGLVPFAMVIFWSKYFYMLLFMVGIKRKKIGGYMQFL